MRVDWLKNYNLLIFETIDSTNSEALRLARAGSIGDFVIFTEQQTGGRGTKGRLWASLAGNLHASILLNVKSDLTKCAQLSFVAANALYETISMMADNENLKWDIKLKWPNDVLINGKKVAGILLESISLDSSNYVVIGFGVNIAAFPTTTIFPATCLCVEGLKRANVDEFLYLLVSKVDKLYKQWCFDNNFVKTRRDWMRRAYNLNKVITLQDGNRRVSGIFKEINLEGGIRLHLANDQWCDFTSAEILYQE